MLKVIKRDGRIKEYDFARICSVVLKVYKDVYSSEDDIADRRVEMDSVIMELHSRLEKLVHSGDTNTIEVEKLQDMIIETLEKYNKEVSKSYSQYRKNRTIIRESKTNLLKSISKIIDSTNHDVLKENSNKQGQLESTKRDLIAGEVSKEIARQIIPKHLMDAHDAGIIKIHDLDYFMQNIYNCELVNLEDMLQNGTVINKKMIDKPKSLRTAMTLATQIAAQVASFTYGGQTMSLSHLAPFVRISKEKIENKYRKMNLGITEEQLKVLVKCELMDEIKDAVQTFNYQISTIMTTNGQSPFISVCMYISENPEYEEETVMLIEEFLKQRIAGIKNEYGVVATQTFPKLLYFLDENNTYEGSEYYWLTELAAKSTSIRMNPDYISVKKMKELVGYAFPCMGCRAFLSPFKDKDGKPIFYGRGNLGVCTINLPHAALSSGGDLDKFWKILGERLEMAREVGEIRYNKMKGVKASVAPIIWQHGAIARLNHDEDIIKAIDERGFTVTIGYSGVYETVKYLIGESHTSPKGFALAREIMSYMRDMCELFKKAQPHLRFALYGTPQESTTGWFNDALRREFGDIDDITNKGWITNSYHVDIREDIDAFEKLEFESKLQQYSTGGAVSYVETVNMQKNVDAVLEIVKHIYETIMYAEINFESDVCGKCKYSGTMDNDPVTLNWVCPQCGNDDQETLSVVRRTCGYLGETEWTDGRKLDILNRVKHL
jgi:ribonucleoside-triphosphate reductase|nr:MAG TPA: anaerobic ribonucleoside triphosphate reductase [Caudoviricetes sp.]